MALDCNIDPEDFPPGGFGFNTQLLWQPAVEGQHRSEFRTKRHMSILLQKSEVVPQKPYSVQQVFSGHVVPGFLANLPHSPQQLRSSIHSLYHST